VLKKMRVFKKTKQKKGDFFMKKKVFMLFFAVLLAASFTNAWAQYSTTGPTSTADSNTRNVTLAGELFTIDYSPASAVTGLDNQTALAADLIPGDSYSVSVTWGTFGGNYGNAGSVWIDWDNSETFEAGELIGSWTGTPTVTESYPFTVPAGFTGSTRMRVMQQEGGSIPLNPDASFTWGSKMDFTIQEFVAGAPGSPSAPTPANNAANVPLSGTLEWTFGADTDTYDLWFGPAGNMQEVVSGAAAGATGSYAYTNINAYAYYEWQVIAHNASLSTDGILWKFITEPRADQLAESFEGTTFPPAGWLNPGAFTRSTLQFYHGVASAYKFTASGGEKSRLVTPLLDITATSTIDFYARTTSANTDQRLVVEYSADGVTWTEIGTPIAFAASQPWQAYSVDLGSLAGTRADYYLAFAAYNGGTSTGTIYIDFVSGPDVVPVAPGAVTLTAPADAAVNASITPTLSWTVGTGGIPAGFKIYLDEVDGSTLYDDVPSSPYNVTVPLSYSTTYYWKVVAYNAVGDAPDSAVRSFTTLDDPTLTPPFLEEFTTWPALNWTQGSGILAPTTTITTGTMWAHHNFGNTGGAFNAAYINIYGTRNHWLFTPPIDLGAAPRADLQLEFDIALTPWTGTTQSTLGPDDYVAVVISTDNGATWSNANVLADWDATDTITPTGDNYVIPLGAYSGIVKFGFYAERPSGTDPDLRFYVDNVRVREEPLVPVFSVTPTSWDYGQVDIGAAATRQFTITNDGGGTLTINTITMPFGTPPAFTFTENNAPATLGAGQSTTFTVQFAPTAVGVLNATVNINDDRALSTVALTGEGVDNSITLPWSEDFTGVATGALAANWTRSHGNWGANATANAGGVTPEMRLNWTPAVTAEVMLITPQLAPAVAGEEWTVSFDHYLDFYGGAYTLKLQSSNDGVTWTDEWSVVDPGANVGPESITVDLGVKNGPFYLAWVGSGNTFNINYWYVDNVDVYVTPDVFWDLTMLAPVGSGTVVPDVGVHNYGNNAVVNLTARPALGFFDEWQVDGAFYSADRMAPLTMDANYNAQAFFTLPAGALAQGFNAGNPVPGEWTETGTTNSWEYKDASFFFTMFDGFTTIGQFNGDPEEMLITPALVLDGSINDFAFWLAGGNNLAGHGGSTLQLKYQPVGTRVWTDLGAPIDMIDNNGLQYVTYDLSAIPNGTYNFAFATISTFATTGFVSWVGIDNVVGPVLASVQDNDLEVASVTYQKDIIFEGDIAVLSAEIVNVGLNPQTGTEVTFTVNDGRTVLTTNIGTLNYGESEVVTVNYTTVGGRHTITAEVAADDNAANNSATTQGVVAVTGNLAEGFEGTVDGWSAGAEWTLWNAAWLPPYEGALSIAAGGSTFAESYLITPMVTIGADDELNFYAAFGNQGVGPADLSVAYSADGAVWTGLVSGIIPNDVMELYTVDLSGVTPGDYYLAFIASATFDGSFSTWITIDHVIGPELTPQTIDTPANFAIAMVGGIPQLSWDAVTGAVTYNVYGGADPYGVLALLGATDQLTYDLTGTEGYQFYYVTASTDALPPVMAARKTIVVSKESANRSVSLVKAVDAKEYIAPEAKTTSTRSYQVPKGF
jgi:hypothetical protein